MIEIKLPKLGIAMEKAVITRWLKIEGDYVKKGEKLYEIETEKTIIEINSPHSGYLKEIIKGEGEEVFVSEVIAVLTSEKNIISNKKNN